MGMNDWPVVDRWWPQRNEWSRVKYGTFLLSLFLVLGALPYGLINRFSAWRGTTSLKVELPIDTELPFVAWMVIPYYSFYLYFPWAAWVGAQDRYREQGLLFFQRLIVSAWIAFACFLIFPVEIDLRSQALDAEGLRMDDERPPRCRRSLQRVAVHPRAVEHPGRVFRTVRQHEQRNVDHADRSRCLISCALLVASTALIKQHYVFDGISGTALAVGLWYGWIRPALN